MPTELANIDCKDRRGIAIDRLDHHRIARISQMINSLCQRIALQVQLVTRCSACQQMIATEVSHRLRLIGRK